MLSRFLDEHSVLFSEEPVIMFCEEPLRFSEEPPERVLRNTQPYGASENQRRYLICDKPKNPNVYYEDPLLPRVCMKNDTVLFVMARSMIH